MPIYDWTPNAEIHTQPDTAQWVGEVLFTVADEGDPPLDADVLGPASWAQPPSDIYALLHSRSTFRIGLNASDRLNFAMASEGGLLGAWSFRVHPDSDKIQVVSTGEAFSIAILAPNAWGMTGAISSSLVGGEHVATAQVDWARGPVAGEDCTFTVTGATSTFSGTFEMPSGVYQGVPEMLVSFDDVSDTASAAYDPLHRATDNLSHLLQTAMGSPSGGWFYRADSGHVVVVIQDNYSLDIDTDFCRWLGFDGDEEFVEIATDEENVYLQATATNLPPHCARLNRGLDGIEPWIVSEVSGAQASDGGIERRHIFTLHGWSMLFTLEGPSRGPLENSRRAINEVLAHMHKCDVITVFQSYRERRLSGARHILHGLGSGVWDPNYSAISTPEASGYLGCLRLALPLEAREVALTLLDARSRALYAPIQWQMFPYIHRQGA